MSLTNWQYLQQTDMRQFRGRWRTTRRSSSATRRSSRTATSRAPSSASPSTSPSARPGNNWLFQCYCVYFYSYGILYQCKSFHCQNVICIQVPRAHCGGRRPRVHDHQGVQVRAEDEGIHHGGGAMSQVYIFFKLYSEWRSLFIVEGCVNRKKLEERGPCNF